MRAIVAGCLFLVSGLGSFAVSASTQEAPVSDMRSSYAALMSCPDDAQGGKDFECIRSLWLNAVDEGHDQEFMEAAWTAEQELPYFFTNCHNAAHEAGRYAAETTGKSAYWLSRAKAYPEACGFGFVHGVSDAFALRHPAPGEIAEFVKGCLDLPASTRRDCADGVGHGFWQAYRQPAQGVEACELFDERRMVDSCVAGLGMQQFNVSRDGYAHSYPYYLGPLLVPGLCRQQVELASPAMLESVADGCGSAAALTLGTPGTAASADAIEEVSKGASLPSVVDELAAVWNDAINLCLLLEEPSQRKCNEDMPLRVYWSASGTDSPLLKELCPKLGYSLDTMCYDEGGERKLTPSPWERAKLVTKLP